jgi:hypothetical protein
MLRPNGIMTEKNKKAKIYKEHKKKECKIDIKKETIKIIIKQKKLKKICGTYHTHIVNTKLNNWLGFLSILIL